MTAPVYMWRATHIAEGGASHVDYVIAPTNADADAHMARLYGLPRFSAVMRMPRGAGGTGSARARLGDVLVRAPARTERHV
jgi:hypothetical protein